MLLFSTRETLINVPNTYSFQVMQLGVQLSSGSEIPFTKCLNKQIEE